MMDTFLQTANEAQPDQPPAPDAGAGANGEQPQRRPTFELLEVKMLRMLQVDLQARTREYQQRLAGLLNPPRSTRTNVPNCSKKPRNWPPNRAVSPS